MIPERRQTALLTRMFFGRLFESDLMPAGLPQIQLVVWVIAFLGAPSALAPILLSKKYVWSLGDPVRLEEMMQTDRTLALLLSMVATGLITLVVWESVFPDRRDARILGVLPVRARSFVLARMAAMLALFTMLVVAMTVLSSLSFGISQALFGAKAGFAGTAISHFSAAAGLEATVFFGIIAVQCALVNTVGIAAAHKLAVLLQVAVVVMVLQMPLLVPVLSFPQVPPAAPIAGLLTAIAAIALYGASYKRMTRLAMEGTGGSGLRMPRLRRIVPVVSRWTTFTPEARGVCEFTLRTVARSRRHRMLLAGWIGVAVAIVISSMIPIFLRGGWEALARPRPAVLAAPLVLSALMLVGVRMLFAIPSEIRANWSIRARHPAQVRLAINGAVAALFVCVMPTVILGFVSATALWGLRVGVLHAAFCGLLGVLLAQCLALGLDKMPFTCTYMPGKARVIKLWPVYLTAFSFYTYTMSGVESILLQKGGMDWALGILAVLALGVTLVRRRGSAQLMVLRFEEEDNDALTLVSL